MFDKVLEEVEEQCRAERIPMLGPEKAKLLASCVEKAKPSVIVECGTAIGYSGLWMLRTLKNLGAGRLITVEINADSAQRARDNFEKAGMADLVDSRIGDAAEVLKTVQDPVDFLFLDNNKDGYFACFKAIESQLTNPATIVADNVGRADQMADYLEHVRSNYESETHWFESWRRRLSGNGGDNQGQRRRDGMEVTIYRS
ncbi:MAG: class I SAM-dependent methyltransferase [Candidatus Poribacteria bacterium]|nr:class I SAM-dependent methyltransferase [Candidatus Poribacteria bacterium]